MPLERQVSYQGQREGPTSLAGAFDSSRVGERLGDGRTGSRRVSGSPAARRLQGPAEGSQGG
jgi:hypothetical protein